MSQKEAKRSRKWTELSHEGRHIRRAFNLAVRVLKTIEKNSKAGEPINLMDLDTVVGLLTKCAKMNTDIISKVDHDQRLKDIEFIIENIPAEIIVKVKKDMKK